MLRCSFTCSLITHVFEGSETEKKIHTKTMLNCNLYSKHICCYSKQHLLYVDISPFIFFLELCELQVVSNILVIETTLPFR